LILGLALAACGPAPQRSAPLPPLDPVLSSKEAKQLFGYVDGPSAQTAEVIGGYAKGCLAGGALLPETGPTWQAMRLSRNRNWAHPVTIDVVQDLSRVAAQQPGWQGLYVGDMSQPRGGPMLTGHRSHQSGLDVDIWMKPALDLSLSPAARERISSDSMQRADGALVNAAWSPTHHALLRAAARDPRVDRIFVFPGAKVVMCDAAGRGDAGWLRKIRPWWGHDHHFHVRLACPAGETACVGQAPPPPGDGCDASLAWWFTTEPWAPSDAPPPEPLTLADLPARCAALVTAE
ncbi:MAG: penicillin-insensitive murein endopeptidase, partial [Alphaproteobacteria bacterium]